MPKLGLQKCPRLRVDQTGAYFTDLLGREHDLATEPTLSLKQAKADLRVRQQDVYRLVAGLQLFPVFRRNARVIEVYACAIDDFRRRELTRSANR